MSILELLEYGFTRKDINRAMAKGVIEFDKPPMPSASETMSKRDVVHHVPETGDYYFRVLSSKVKLTKLDFTCWKLLKQTCSQLERKAVYKSLRKRREARSAGQLPSCSIDAEDF